MAVEITMKELLEAGVHFGHQTRRWNPKMKEYIFGERNGIHIIDLQKTLKMFREASRFVSEISAHGRTVLFVGTKRQAQEAVAEEAKRCGAYYVNHRWLGGTLTNWATLQKSIKRLKLLKAMGEDGRMEELSKKERARLDREMKHLLQNLAGIENMTQLPDAMFVIDSNAEEIAVKEARRMGVPVVSVVDTNCDPDVVDWIIPGNDDALARDSFVHVEDLGIGDRRSQLVRAIAGCRSEGRSGSGDRGRRRVRRYQQVRAIREAGRRLRRRRGSGSGGRTCGGTRRSDRPAGRQVELTFRAGKIQRARRSRLQDAPGRFASDSTQLVTRRISREFISSKQ